MCQLTPNRCWIDFSNTLAPFGRSRYVSFSNEKIGKSFRNKPRDYGTPSFFRQRFGSKKPPSTQRTKEPGPGRSGPGFPGRLPWRSPKASRILASRVSSCHRYHGLSGVKVSGFWWLEDAFWRGSCKVRFLKQWKWFSVFWWDWFRFSVK